MDLKSLLAVIVSSWNFWISDLPLAKSQGDRFPVYLDVLFLQLPHTAYALCREPAEQDRQLGELVPVHSSKGGHHLLQCRCLGLAGQLAAGLAGQGSHKLSPDRQVGETQTHSGTPVQRKQNQRSLGTVSCCSCCSCFCCICGSHGAAGAGPRARRRRNVISTRWVVI